MSSSATRSDLEKINSDLRKRAIANSQKAAREMAASYGMHIKGVYSVSEVAPDFAYGIKAGTWDGEGNGLRTVVVTGSKIPDIALRVGTMKVEQNIYAVYLTAP